MKTIIIHFPVYRFSLTFAFYFLSSHVPVPSQPLHIRINLLFRGLRMTDGPLTSVSIAIYLDMFGRHALNTPRI